MPDGTSTIEDLLADIDAARERERLLSLEEVLDAVGRRSFGPLLMLAGLVVLAPVVGDIPGMPTMVAVFVAVIASQILIGRDRVWLPEIMLSRSIRSTRLEKPLRWLVKPARWFDRLTRDRLRPLVNGVAPRVIAAICLGIAALMPLMEVVPFSANAAGVILVAFGLALVAGDGLMALVGGLVSLATIVLIGIAVL